MSLYKIDPATYELVRTEAGGYERVSGLEEVTQGCHHRANLGRGECRHAADKGLPWFTTAGGLPSIFAKGVPAGLIESTFQVQLGDVPGVEAIDWIRLTQDEEDAASRHAQITYSAKVSLDKLRADIPVRETIEIRSQA